MPGLVQRFIKARELEALGEIFRRYFPRMRPANWTARVNTPLTEN
jgi:hypothetical protein